MLLSYFEAVFEIMELNTTEVELSGVKINCVVKFSSEIVDYFQNTSLIFAT